MTFVESFIERVLAVPESAIPRAASAQLTRYAEGRLVLELRGQSVDLWGLVESGRCTRRFREQAHSQMGFTSRRARGRRPS